MEYPLEVSNVAWVAGNSRKQILEVVMFISDSVWKILGVQTCWRWFEMLPAQRLLNILRMDDGDRGSGSCGLEKRGIAGFRFCTA